MDFATILKSAAIAAAGITSGLMLAGIIDAKTGALIIGICSALSGGSTLAIQNKQ